MKPLEWHMACSMSEIYDYSSNNLQDWKYRGDYWEAPDFLICTHGNPKIENSPVNMISITHENKDPHAVGKCEVCGRILWIKIVPRQ